MMWNQLKGHQTQIDLFRRAVESGRLSQAYLLSGPGGIGKHLFARGLAAGLFCDQPPGVLDACGQCPSCRQVQADTHPDLLQVGCPEGKSEIPIELLAGSREKRGREGLCYELSLRPSIADRRIAIINDVEKLNVASANTLLKTLEEPPAQAMFLLIVNQPEALLPTIRSRCQMVRFPPLSRADIAALLLEHDVVQESSEADAIAELAGGSMEAAGQLADATVRELHAVARDLVVSDRLARPMQAASEIVTAIEATSSDTQTQRDNAVWFLRFVGNELQAALRRSAMGDATGVGQVQAEGLEGTDILGAMLERVLDAEEHLRQRMQLALCFESFLDDLRRIASGHLIGSKSA